MEIKRKRGGQPGNQNAKIPELYGRFINKTQRALLKKALKIYGLDEEIAMLRLQLLQIIIETPERWDLRLKTADTIDRLVRTRDQISKARSDDLKNAISKVYAEIAAPLGIKYFIK